MDISKFSSDSSKELVCFVLVQVGVPSEHCPNIVIKQRRVGVIKYSECFTILRAGMISLGLYCLRLWHNHALDMIDKLYTGILGSDLLLSQLVSEKRKWEVPDSASRYQTCWWKSGEKNVSASTMDCTQSNRFEAVNCGFHPNWSNLFMFWCKTCRICLFSISLLFHSIVPRLLGQ